MLFFIDQKMYFFFFFFFFQAEDGIRDHCVTGVQTCALPISTELLRYLGWMPLQYDIRLTGRQARLDILDRPDGKCSGQRTTFIEPSERRLWLRTNDQASDDENAPSPLREAVMSSIHHAPLHEISEVRETREDDREVTPPL